MLLLEGIRVLDLMHLSGYCGMELADYGAEVIKVECVGDGDPLRKLEPERDGASVHHAFRDRGKKSITLDLTTDKGQEVFRRLAKTADVILENFSGDKMEEWNIGYETLAELNPKLVYGRISTYGKEKEDVTPHVDLLAQAKSGVMHFTGFPENPPTRIGFPIAEHYAASFLSAAICIALYNAKDTGVGQIVETTLLGSVIAISEDKVITYGADGEDPMRTGNAHPLINPYDILKCKDGYVAMGISSDAQWTKFCKAFKMPEWDVDPLYCSNLVRGYHYFGDLRNKLEELFSKYTMQEISDICDEHLIPGTMCSTTKEAISQPQLLARNMVVNVADKELGEITMPGKPVKFAGAEENDLVSAPMLGEDNFDIYGELGFEKEELRMLEQEGVI